MLNIHIVISGTPEGNEPYPVITQSVDNTGTHIIIDEHAHNIIAFGKIDRILRKLCLVEFYFKLTGCIRIFK